jgi:epoxyqueuosine reductase
MPVASDLTAEVLACGRRGGLDAVGVTSADVLSRARSALVERKSLGLHDGMKFTYKNPQRSTDPRASMPDACSVVVAARSYLEPEPQSPVAAAGRVARYAWRDHYAPLRAGLWDIAYLLRAAGHRAVVFADDNSMVDREVAYQAGIGWFGKNANLLLPGHGSYFVLGSVVTTAALDPTGAPVADGCGSCRRCLDSCPTDAIIAPGVIDAGRCLAWLAQKPGIFPTEFRRSLGVRLYGCDACQDVCPPNVRFGRAVERDAPQVWVDLVDLLSIDDTTLLARHGRWYIADREPRWVRRNALIALGNAGRTDPPVLAILARYLAAPDYLLRVPAAWAALALGLEQFRPKILADSHPEVRAEAAAGQAAAAAGQAAAAAGQAGVDRAGGA